MYPQVILNMDLVVNMTQLVYSLTLELLSQPIIRHADRIPPTHNGFDHVDLPLAHHELEYCRMRQSVWHGHNILTTK